MTLHLSRSKNLPVAVALAVSLAGLAGCGLGTTASPNAVNTTGVRAKGLLHGGPNPIQGATMTLYATGDSGGASTGYGVGTPLNTATTDVNGNYTFPGGYTCPAGQYAYVVATGGNTGANVVNPNSVLITALGPCSNVSASTFIFTNELTTAAAAYALSNFINITGNASTGWVVGIGAPATNNGATGCVNNAYYGTGTCPTTVAAGLKHAFQNAAMLVGNTNGIPAAKTSTGALVPVQEINTLGNILQACINSSGGGTNTITGAPTTTTTSGGGTTHDGTPCGKLFAFTSYTDNGTATGTLHAPGNTLQAMVNLAKRPIGSATLFNSTCDSGSTGTTTAASCIFNLGTPIGIYQTSMTSAPTDWTMGVSYAKGSFSTSTTGATCSGAPTTNGTLYPFMVATDINDNVVILNGDASTSGCYNLLTIGSDGTSLSGNDFDTATAVPVWIATDAFGHAIVPVKGSSENGIRIYGATDANIPLVGSVAAVTNTPTNLPFYVAVGLNDSIYVASQGSTTTSAFGYLTVSGPESHSAPAYTTVIPSTVNTNKFNGINVDINGNGFSTQSSSSASKTVGIAAGGTTSTPVGVLSGATGNGIITATDNSGNIWNIENVAASPSTGLLVFKQTYSVTGTTMTIGTASTVTTLTPGAVKPQGGQMDGNQIIWFTDLQGSTSTTPISISSLRGYDVVNNFDTKNYYGCKFFSATSTACGTQSTDSSYPSNTPYLFYGSRGLAIDAAGSIWVANGTQGQINEIIGLAAPTWPLFVHNGTSNKP